ncbi:hypothetical protein NSPZN2_160004 [Nitrospira defluvii]|uniref:Transposase n=1 Tax=Nitrospira defluvii TaxID=330214 RepID=A0ABM8RB76_9BACT|nr:hypothetical protein NSPZN2_160004 [Nitrospira defluvii]
MWSWLAALNRAKSSPVKEMVAVLAREGLPEALRSGLAISLLPEINAFDKRIRRWAVRQQIIRPGFNTLG